MKHLTLIGFLCLLALPVQAQKVFAGLYGTETTFPFEIWSSDGLSLDGAQADAGTDATYRCGTGAEATTTNDYTDEGTTYSIVLTATEMQCSGVITVFVNETVDAVFYVQTMGNASAQFTGIQQTGDAYARLGAPAGASVSADIAAIEGQTDDIGVAGAGLTEAGGTGDQLTALGGFTAGAITAAAIATGAIDADATSADFRTEIQDADVESINGVTITGDGSVSPFGVAWRRQQEDFLSSCMTDMSKRDIRKAVKLAERYGFQFEQCNDARLIQAGGFSTQGVF